MSKPAHPRRPHLETLKLSASMGGRRAVVRIDAIVSTLEDAAATLAKISPDASIELLEELAATYRKMHRPAHRPKGSRNKIRTPEGRPYSPPPPVMVRAIIAEVDAEAQKDGEPRASNAAVAARIIKVFGYAEDRKPGLKKAVERERDALDRDGYRPGTGTVPYGSMGQGHDKK